MRLFLLACLTCWTLGLYADTTVTDLESLRAAMQTNGVVTLANSILLYNADAPIEVPVDADVTLNLNGKTLTKNTISGSQQFLFAVYGKLTIQGTGTIRRSASGISSAPYIACLPTEERSDVPRVVVLGGTWGSSGGGGFYSALSTNATLTGTTRQQQVSILGGNFGSSSSWIATYLEWPYVLDDTNTVQTVDKVTPKTLPSTLSSKTLAPGYCYAIDDATTFFQTITTLSNEYYSAFKMKDLSLSKVTTSETPLLTFGSGRFVIHCEGTNTLTLAQTIAQKAIAFSVGADTRLTFLGEPTSSLAITASTPVIFNNKTPSVSQSTCSLTFNTGTYTLIVNGLTPCISADANRTNECQVIVENARLSLNCSKPTTLTEYTPVTVDTLTVTKSVVTVPSANVTPVWSATGTCTVTESMIPSTLEKELQQEPLAVITQAGTQAFPSEEASAVAVALNLLPNSDNQIAYDFGVSKITLDANRNVLLTGHLELTQGQVASTIDNTWQVLINDTSVEATIVDTTVSEDRKQMTVIFQIDAAIWTAFQTECSRFTIKSTSFRD